MGKLDGKVAIITGSGQGIGKGIALAMAKEGAKVVIAERNAETAKATEKEIKGLGGQALAVTCDVLHGDQIKNMVAEAVKKFGTVDILVNNAQAGGRDTSIEEMDEKAWDLCFDSGPKAAMLCSKAVLPHMKIKGGKIINLGSPAGLAGSVTQSPAYPSCKEAIRGFSRRAAREWGKYRINVNVICPTAMTPSFAAHEKVFPDKIAMALKSRAIPRWGDPEMDIGHAAVFLASWDSDYITGHTLMVDGGGQML